MRIPMTLPVQMALGMTLGVLSGVGALALGIPADWFQPVGQLFITLVRMVVVPLVLVTLISGAASVGGVSRMGRIAGKCMLYYFATTAVAVVIGLALAGLVQPGAGLDFQSEVGVAKEVSPPALVNVLLQIVPVNPIEAMSKGNMLQIIFFAVLVGFAISAVGEAAAPAARFFEAMSEVMLKMASIVMLYAPIGVFGLMAYTVSKHGLSVLLPLIGLVLVVYAACVIQVLLVYVPCVLYAGLSPRVFFKGLSEPLLIAFSTCSSAAALSSNLVSVQKLGASRTVASFSIPLGNTINMDGSAIYIGVSAVFAAAVYNVPMPLETQLVVVLMSLLASVGTMGVPGAALLMMTMVFTQVGIPLEAVGLVAGIDRIVDMARTTVNVLGDATGAVLVSRLENDIDPKEATNTAA